MEKKCALHDFDLSTDSAELACLSASGTADQLGFPNTTISEFTERMV